MHLFYYDCNFFPIFSFPFSKSTLALSFLQTFYLKAAHTKVVEYSLCLQGLALPLLPLHLQSDMPGIVTPASLPKL